MVSMIETLLVKVLLHMHSCHTQAHTHMHRKTQTQKTLKCTYIHTHTHTHTHISKHIQMCHLIFTCIFFDICRQGKQGNC